MLLVLLIGLELKHYVADYMLQPPWLLRGKGDVRQPGGYVHAGVHVAGSLLVFLVAGVAWPAAGLIVAAEFPIHYGADYAKAHYAGGVDAAVSPWRFWALHGFDQLLHQLTYAGMIGFALAAMGPG
jgi:hypothetical protein